MWPFRRKPAAPIEPTAPRVHYLTHIEGKPGFGPKLLDTVMQALHAMRPSVSGIAMDDASTGQPSFKASMFAGALPDALVGWFASQGFIGYQVCAMVAQQWLVDKACTIPARDAIRHGYDIHIKGMPAPLEPDGDEDAAEAELVEEIRDMDKLRAVSWNMEQFVRMGRIFGVRVAFFKVDSADPLYYEKPFNIDGVTPGSYRGIAQVDPYWCIPELDGAAVNDPSSPNFYEPTWWVIGGKRYHRTHLCIFRNSDLPDILKPMYVYGGVSVPQKILERVYAAERTANEGPQLAMTKRLTVWKTDLTTFYANQENALRHAQTMAEYRDNHGVKLVDTEDDIQQTDTALGDLDTTIMTQYQLVAAAANMPATKLLGTTPTGFNSSGEYEEASYHEELEAIQTNDLTPFLDRHYALLLRSEVEPDMGLPAGTLSITIDWAAVDSPTAKEYAEINKMNAETDNILVMTGAIEGEDVRNRLKSDRNSGYTGIKAVGADDETITDIVNEALGNGSEETPAIEDPAGLGGAA